MGERQLSDVPRQKDVRINIYTMRQEVFKNSKLESMRLGWNTRLLAEEFYTVTSKDHCAIGWLSATRSHPCFDDK